MVTVHAVLGLILVLMSIFMLVWSILRASGRVHTNKIRRAFIGLLDLQVLLGIITWILHPHGGLFILHPVLMLIGVGLLHMFTKESRAMRTQIVAYTVAAVVFIIGMFLAGF